MAQQPALRDIDAFFIDQLTDHLTNYKKIKALIDDGADVNLKFTDRGRQFTPLDAVMLYTAFKPLNDRQKTIDLLLERGATPTSEYLLSSVFQSNKNGIRLSIEKGVDVNGSDQYGRTPLRVAIVRSDIPIIDFLLENGAIVDQTKLWNSIGTPEVIDYFVNQGFDVNNKIDGMTPIMMIRPNLNLINRLVELGADVHTKDDKGKTVLDHVLRTQVKILPKELFEIVQFLLDKGTEFTDIPDDMPQTVKKLLGKKLKPTGTSNEMLMSALSANIPVTRINELLKAEDLDVNLQDKNGVTPLMLAARNGKKSIIQKLLAKGAVPAIKDKKKQTAYDYAKTELIKKMVSPVWRGFSEEELGMFNSLYDTNLSQNSTVDISVCPYCFSLVTREDGCMAMSHKCLESASRFISIRMYELYKTLTTDDSGNKHYKGWWCTTCSRPMKGHYHTVLKRMEDIKTKDDIIPTEVRVGEDGVGADIFGSKHGPEIDCKLLGGGGLTEKFQRINAFIRKANELQSQIGKISTKEASEQLLQAAWNAPLQEVDKFSRDQKLEQAVITEESKTLQKQQLEKEEKVKTQLMEKVKTKTENEPPRVLGQEGDAGAVGAGGGGVGGYCIIELGVHPDNRLTYAFRHRQPDKTMYNHSDEEAICVEDLVDMLKHPADPTQPFACTLNPGKCKGIFHPDDLAALPGIDQTFLENYTRRFKEELVFKMIGARRRTTYRANKKRTLRKRTYRR